MNLDFILRTEIQKAVSAVFQQQVEYFQIQPTNQEFEGSHTLVCFPLAKISRKGPEETARLIGDHLVAHSGIISKYNVVKGFLNLVLLDSVCIEVFRSIHTDKNFGVAPANGKEIMVEYSSPNTNKPLHLGHLRNNFLGWSVAEIYKAIGYKVHKVQIINDRGIHICKSMAAWKLYGNSETPQGTGLKGDKLVGKYYVEFDKVFKSQVKELEEKGVGKESAEKEAPIMKLAVDMLQKWEGKDADTLALWKTMNGWVYDGFAVTYKRMGVDFEKLYYESSTYLLGKEEVLRGVEQGIFFRKDDGSVWVDLTSDGLDQKVLLRADGTSVYMTQDFGTAILRFRDFPRIEKQVYTVGNEQEYHFKVLFLILGKLGYAWAKECYHLSYGMVDLPSGKMKSREGTVVDADDLMEEMVEEAARQTRELGKIEEMEENELKELSEMIGLGALKFFLLKVDPRKRMLFDPAESIQLQGHTGPFIQYTYARIRSVLRKAEAAGIKGQVEGIKSLEPAERQVTLLVNNYLNKLAEAAHNYSPAVIANYAFDLAKEYNQFYQSIPIFNETDQSKLKFRIAFSHVVADVLKSLWDCWGSLCQSECSSPDQMKVLIRPFEGSDTTSLLELFHGTVHHVNNKDYPPEHLDAWAPPVPDAKKWKDRFKSSETIVAVVNGKVAGFGNLERESSAIGMLYVHKDQLRQGVATALLEKLERMLSKRGLTNASVEASITARPFFEKQGYHLLREHRKMLNGTEFINFIMEKELNLPASEPVETAQVKDKDKKKKSFSWGGLFINKFFDLLMVIIGVTIAFQLNNLKVESDQRSLERFYLESMQHDLDKDIAKCRQNLQDIQSDRKLLTGYLVKLEQTQPPTDSLGIVIVRTVWFETFSGNQDTYSTLLASNGFSTLAEQSIRSQITEYYKQYLSISRFETVYTELVFRMVGYFSPYCDFAKQEIIDPSVVKRVETRNYLLLALGQLKDSDEIYTRMIEKAESLKKNIQLTLQK